MTIATSHAVGLIVLAAAMNGTYVLPMRVNRRWEWEHSWLAFTVLGVVAVPTVLAWLTVPGLWSLYAATPVTTLLGMAAAGAAWGVSLVFFGLAVTLVGVAITFAVSLGTSAAAGALIPLVTQHTDRLFTMQSAWILGGVALILGGVALCGIAGHRRDGIRTASSLARAPLRGFLFALLSGILGSLLNLGFALGGVIQQGALANGASPAMMSNAVWLPCLFAGAVPGVVYCLFLMRRNRNTHALAGQARWYYWVMAALMGVLWFGSIMCYSIATVKLGDLGPVIGWPLFMSAIVIASSIAGVLTGEWKDVGPLPSSGPIRFMYAGVACLLVAMAVLAWASARA
jgi:L-rhamnose-H+ transport protein